MKEINKSRSMKSLLFFLTALFLIACSTKEKQHDLQPAEFPAFSAESHRGGRGDMPENTIPAMLYSLSLADIQTVLLFSVNLLPLIVIAISPLFQMIKLNLMQKLMNRFQMVKLQFLVLV